MSTVTEPEIPVADPDTEPDDAGDEDEEGTTPDLAE